MAEFVPLSPGSDYFEGHYDDVWTQIDTRASFPNTCLCDTALDNGAGLSWNLTVPAGGSITRSHRVRWGSGGINQAPVPIMSGLPVDGGGPFTLTFEGGGSFDLDGQVVGYEWDFGDGGTSTEQTPTHGYLATGTFTVSLTVTDDDGGIATAFEDLTITGVTSVDFAPEVRLHPEEDHFPMNPVTFVDGANLQWAHDHGCDNDFVVENPIADLLGQPNEYEHRVDRGVFPRCGRHSGRHYDSQDYTRPFDDGNPERENIAGEEGFYLDFDEGSEPDAFSPVPVWTERTTLADGNTALTYWFFYGRSVPRWNGIGLPTQHEGDWEHVNLIMDATTLVPGEVWFYAHGGEPDRQPFAALTRTGFIHPVVYSARTAHGSYPTTGVTDVCNERGCIEDIRADGGDVWETWRDVRSATDQGWYGFGGAWGAKGEAGDTTGPLGPSSYKNPV